MSHTVIQYMLSLSLVFISNLTGTNSCAKLIILIFTSTTQRCGLFIFQLIALLSAWRYVTSGLRTWPHPRFCTANILHQGNIFFDLILHCASYIEENLQREFTEQLVSCLMFPPR